MTATLNLFDHLLTLGRRYQDQGRTRDALGVFGRLADFRELPAATAAETQERLAELQLKRRKYRRARRHLAAALTYRPDSARLLHLMATAVQSEDRGDLDRAGEYYGKALAQEPDHVPCLADGGLLAVRLGQTDEGLARLRRAIELEPDNADVVAKLVKGLRLAGLGDDARQVLRAALFRNPRVLRFRRLWDEFQFKDARQRQESARRRRRPRDDGAPVLLPFVGVGRDELASVRLDGPATVGRPHRPRKGSPTDPRRHVQ